MLRKYVRNEGIMKAEAGVKMSKLNRILRVAFLLPCVMVVLMLGGCGSDVTVTAEQNDLIAEYIAGTLMKYSYENEWKYIKLNDNITNFQRPSGSGSVVNGSGSSSSQNTQNIQNNPVKPSQLPGNSGQSNGISGGSMSDLASALMLDGITISYSGCTVTKSYPEGSDILSVRATNGRDIAAVEFNLKNTSNAAVVCNTAPLGAVMKLSVNNAAGVTEYATMLKNDLNTLSGVTIAPGENFKAVVLFMVPEGSADNITSLELTISGQGVKASKITLK